MSHVFFSLKKKNKKKKICKLIRWLKKFKGKCDAERTVERLSNEMPDSRL